MEGSLSGNVCVCVCVHLHVLSAIVLCMSSIGFSCVTIFICLPVFVTGYVYYSQVHTLDIRLLL